MELKLPQIKGVLGMRPDSRGTPTSGQLNTAKGHSLYSNGGSFKNSIMGQAKNSIRSTNSRNQNQVITQEEQVAATYMLRQEAYKRTLLRSLNTHSFQSSALLNSRGRNSVAGAPNMRSATNAGISHKQINHLMMTPQPRLNKINQPQIEANKIQLSIQDLHEERSEYKNHDGGYYSPHTAIAEKAAALEHDLPERQLSVNQQLKTPDRRTRDNSPDFQTQYEDERSNYNRSPASIQNLAQFQAQRANLHSSSQQSLLNRNKKYAHVKGKLNISPPALSVLGSIRSGSEGREDRVNLQALIDREIVIDQLAENFHKGQSLYDIAGQLYAIVIEQDIHEESEIMKPMNFGSKNTRQTESDMDSIFEETNSQLSKSPQMLDLKNYKNPATNFIKDERSLRTLVVSSKLQIIVSKLCLLLDQVLARERIAYSMQITPLIKSLLKYVFHSHIILCTIVFSRIPESARATNKWVNFLEEIIKNKFNKTLQDQIKKSGQTKSIQMIQRNNEALQVLIKTILHKFTTRTGIFETLNLMITYLNKVSLTTLVKLFDEQKTNDVEQHLKGVIKLETLAKQIMAEQKLMNAQEAMKTKFKTNKNFNQKARGGQGLAKEQTKKKKKKLTPMQQQLFEMPRVKVPYLPPSDNEKKYTLVLDLDETLIHYVDMSGEKEISRLQEDGEEEAAEGKDESFFLTRPFCHKFLEEMSKHYEVVIFTAGIQEYADWVVDQLDPDGSLIKHRLYRQHTINRDTENDLPLIIKDLSKIGRDLSRTIIVDNLAENFILQKDSGIFITTWYSDQKDTELQDLIPLLSGLVTNQVSDVRKSLRAFRDQMARRIYEGTHQGLQQALPI